MEHLENTSVKAAVDNAAKTIAKNPSFRRVIKRIVISIIVIAVIGGVGCATIFGIALHFAGTNAMSKDEAIVLAKSHLESNEIVQDVEKLLVNDVEHDIEVELLDIKTSYLVYEIEFGTQDENRIFVEVNATTGACQLRKVSPPWWKAIIPN